MHLQCPNYCNISQSRREIKAVYGRERTGEKETDNDVKYSGFMVPKVSSVEEIF